MENGPTPDAERDTPMDGEHGPTMKAADHTAP
jgi:hypothetical protein